MTWPVRSGRAGGPRPLLERIAALAVVASCCCGQPSSRPAPATATGTAEPGPVLLCAAAVADAVVAPGLEAEPNLTWRMDRLGVAAEVLASTGRTTDAWALVDRAGRPSRVAPKGIAGIAIGSIRTGDARSAREAVTKLAAVDEWTRSASLAAVAAAYQEAGATSEAAEVARRIPDAEPRARALLELGAAARAPELLEEAAAAAWETPPGRTEVLSEEGTLELETAGPRLALTLELLGAWLLLGEPRRAEALLGVMGEVSDDRSASWVAEGQLELAAFRAASKEPAAAAAALAEARRSIEALDRGIPAPFRVVGDLERRASLLTKVARLYGRLGMPEEGREAAAAALETAGAAGSIDEPTIRATVGRELHLMAASAFLALGARDEALPLLDRALALAEEAPVPPPEREEASAFHARSAALESRVEAMAQAAALFEAAGEPDRSGELLGRATALAADIPDDSWRATAWSSIAEAFLDSGGPRRALSVVAPGADGDPSRLEALTTVARRAADGGETALADEAFRAMAPGYGRAALAAELSARADASADSAAARAYLRDALADIARREAGWEMALLRLATTSPAAREPADSGTAAILATIPECTPGRAARARARQGSR